MLSAGNESVRECLTPDSSDVPESKKSKKGLSGDATLDSPSKSKHEKKTKKVKDLTTHVSPTLKKKRKKSKEIEENGDDYTLKPRKEDRVEDEMKDKTSTEEDGKKKRKKKRKYKDEEKVQNEPSDSNSAVPGAEESSEDAVLPSKVYKKQKKKRKQQEKELDLNQDSPIQVSPVALAVEEISGNVQGDRKRKLESHFMHSMDGDGQTHKKRRREVVEAETNGTQRKTSSKKHKHKK